MPFGRLAFPTTCTPRIAWEALRAAMSEADYYSSVAELQLLFAACGTIVEVYEYNENAGIHTMPSFWISSYVLSICKGWMLTNLTLFEA
jgi:hypothetical protein